MSDTAQTSSRCLADFAGSWSLHREIIPAVGSAARFEGTAQWTPAQGGMAYVEQGIMTLAGQPPMRAMRQYLWAEDLSVYFEDGRFFHQIPRQGGEAEHWCDPDWYRVTYDFAPWPLFQVVWQVSGPRKSYRSVTEYRRS